MYNKKYVLDKITSRNAINIAEVCGFHVFFCRISAMNVSRYVHLTKIICCLLCC